MSKRLISLEILVLIFGVQVYGTEAIQSMNSSNLMGRYTDELPKSTEVGKFTQPLIGNPKMALEYRIEGKQEYVMLLESPEDNRWRIVDSIKVPKHSKREFVSFACGVKGASSAEAGAGAVGIVKRVKQSQMVTATHGWNANLESKKLEPVLGKKTICDLRGMD
jgi:hypothetical protein